MSTKRADWFGATGKSISGAMQQAPNLVNQATQGIKNTALDKVNQGANSIQNALHTVTHPFAPTPPTNPTVAPKVVSTPSEAPPAVKPRVITTAAAPQSTAPTPPPIQPPPANTAGNVAGVVNTTKNVAGLPGLAQTAGNAIQNVASRVPNAAGVAGAGQRVAEASGAISKVTSPMAQAIAPVATVANAAAYAAASPEEQRRRGMDAANNIGRLLGAAQPNEGGQNYSFSEHPWKALFGAGKTLTNPVDLAAGLGAAGASAANAVGDVKAQQRDMYNRNAQSGTNSADTFRQHLASGIDPATRQPFTPERRQEFTAAIQANEQRAQQSQQESQKWYRQEVVHPFQKRFWTGDWKMPWNVGKSASVKPMTIKQANAAKRINELLYKSSSDGRDLTPDEEKRVHHGKQQWLGKVFPSYGTPIPEMMSSPGKGSLIGALLAGGLGAAGGGALGHFASGGDHSGNLSGAALGAALGGGLGGLAGGVTGHISRRVNNENLEEVMRHMRPNATYRDYKMDPAVNADLNRTALSLIGRGIQPGFVASDFSAGH